MKKQTNLYAIGYTYYASSHDDFVGIFSSEELANKEAERLNAEYLVGTQQTTFPWDSPPYYVFPVDVRKWLGFARPGYDIESLIKRYPTWLNVMSVPSIGQFHIVPKGCVVIEEFKIDEVEVYD